MAAVARVLLAVAVAVYAAAVVVAAAVLPERVALHFGGTGAADRYGTRAEALVVQAAVGAGLLALALGADALARRAPLRLINVPHAEHWKTPEHEPELRSRLRTDLAGFFAATFGLLTAVSAATTQAATGSGHLPWWFFVAFGTYLLVTAVWLVHQVTARYRPPAAER